MGIIIFVLLAPIYVPILLFLEVTYNWWSDLWLAGPIRTVLFLLLAVIYVPLLIFAFTTADLWHGLLD